MEKDGSKKLVLGKKLDWTGELKESVTPAAAYNTLLLTPNQTSVNEVENATF